MYPFNLFLCLSKPMFIKAIFKLLNLIYTFTVILIQIASDLKNKHVRKRISQVLFQPVKLALTGNQSPNESKEAFIHLRFFSFPSQSPCILLIVLLCHV